jgi:SAM-dependent methyltransferase
MQMPDLDWNKTLWGGGYNWQGSGEEWSAAWGGSEAQWFGALFPRIHRLLPAHGILEIAPGYGRWTHFLIPACSDYLGIDLSAACIDACRTRFRNSPHARFICNDGLSLDNAPDASFDLIFSFDSLVHAEIDIFQAYIPQLIRKLTPNGIAFLHHSNLKGFDNPEGINSHSRANSVSGRNVAKLITESGGKVIIQEIITWDGVGPVDCLTTFGRSDTNGDNNTVYLVNLSFMEEAAIILKYQKPYCEIK